MTGDDPEPLPAVRGAGVGRSNKSPAHVIAPQGGKVGEDGIESQSKVPCDVLKHEQSGS
jgi:hypothetical protein